MKLFIFVVALVSVGLSQPSTRRGIGTASGSDIEVIRMKALNNARADALAKAGIIISAGDTRMASESGKDFTDFYSKFAESSTKGIILGERIVRESELKKITATIYEIEIEIDADVALQQGEPDPSWSVTLESSKQIVKENESFSLAVRSTKGGFLTIFNVYQDSLSVAFPNAIDKDNAIEANKIFKFPPHQAYELQMSLPPGKTSSSEMFIAVVTAENIPFPNLDQLLIGDGAIRLRSAQLNVYAQWLHKVVLHKRSADQIPVTIQR